MLGVSSSAQRILDFDIEARPLGWLGGDFVHMEITAIASAWIVDGKPEDMQVLTLTKRDTSAVAMLKGFTKRYNEADMVVGHYIRGYDLIRINAELVEFGLPTLSEKMTHDTMLDLVKQSGISKSQENMGAMLGIEAPKVKMNVHKWREANRLTEAGIALTVERCAGDVVQNIEMREAMMQQGLLKAPRIWRP